MSVPGLAMEFVAETEAPGRAGADQSVSATIEATAAGATTPGIRVLAMARYPDSKVDATCRLHNTDWARGRNALLGWAASWPDTGGCVLSKRQLLMLEPTALESLPDDPEQEMDQSIGKKRPWWRRIVGGA